MRKGGSSSFRRILLACLAVIAVGLVAAIVIMAASGVRVRVVRESPRVESPIHWAVIDDKPAEVVEDLIENRPSLVEQIDKHFGTTMDFALAANRLDIARVLLELGWDPNRPMATPAESGEHPLAFLIIRRDIEGVRLLMEFGADPQRVDSNGQSAFQLCEDISPADLREQFLEALAPQ